jgi:hypothetical protein
LTALAEEQVLEAAEDFGSRLVLANIERRRGERAAGNSFADFDAKMRRANEEQSKVLPSMNDMLGLNGDPITRTRYTDDTERTFYPVPPKLSALSTLMAGVEQASGYGQLGEALLIMQLASTYLYTDSDEAGKKRQATPEEIEEFLGMADLPMLTKMNEKYLNAIMRPDADPKP